MPKLKTHHIEDPLAFGRRLRSARSAADLTQRALATGAASPAYISRIEAGDRVPSLQLVRLFAERLGVSEQFLITGAEAFDFERALVDANLALRMDELDQAERLLDSVLARDPLPQTRAQALAGLGQLAFRREGLEEAIALLRQAGELSPTLLEDGNLVDTLGRAYAMAGELESAIAVFEQALEKAEARGDELDTLRFRVLLANALIDAASFGRAEELLASAIRQGDQLADPIVRVRLYWSQSRLHALQGNQEIASSYARRALDLLGDTENTLYASRAYQTLAHIELDRGNSVEAFGLLDRAGELLGDGGSRFDRAKLTLERARGLLLSDDRAAAAQTALEAAALLSGLELHDQGRAYLLLGEVFAQLGDDARALEMYELAEEYLRRTPNRYLREVYERMAELFEARGETQAALDVLKRAVQSPSRMRSSGGR